MLTFGLRVGDPSTVLVQFRLQTGHIHFQTGTTIGIGRDLGFQPRSVGMQLGMLFRQTAQLLEHGGNLLCHAGLFGLGMVGIGTGFLQLVAETVPFLGQPA